jgi:hypothetical protein
MLGFSGKSHFDFITNAPKTSSMRLHELAQGQQTPSQN